MCVRGELLRQTGQTDEALAVFRETMERFPHDEVPRNAYAETLRSVGRTDEALAMFRETMERFPHNEVAPNAYAETLREMGLMREALVVLRETASRFSHSEVTRTALADLLITMGDVANGKALLAVAAKRLQFRGDWIALHVLAMGYLRRGDTASAIQMLSRGKAECPFNDVVLYFKTALALALIMDRNAKQALAELAFDLKTPTGSTPETVTRLLVRAHALGECGDIEETQGELLEIKGNFFLSTKQAELADVLLMRYANPATGVPRLFAANDNIFRLEFELMRVAA